MPSKSCRNVLCFLFSTRACVCVCVCVISQHPNNKVPSVASVGGGDLDGDGISFAAAAAHVVELGEERVALSLPPHQVRCEGAEAHDHKHQGYGDDDSQALVSILQSPLVLALLLRRRRRTGSRRRRAIQDLTVTAVETPGANADAPGARAAVFAVVAAGAPSDCLFARRTRKSIRAQACVAGDAGDVALSAVETVVAGEDADARVHLLLDLAVAAAKAEGAAAHHPADAAGAAAPQGQLVSFGNRQASVVSRQSRDGGHSFGLVIHSYVK